MLFKQIKHISDNFSYIIADETSREAIVVDPSYNAEIIIQKGKELRVHFTYIINTHSHRDHIAGNQRIKSEYKAKIVAHKVANINKDVEVVAINDLTSNDTLAHLFKYDSAQGTFPGKVSATDKHIVIGNKKIISLSERNPANLPWKKLKVDLVLECTGVFRTYEKAGMHLTAGAKRVLLSAPAKSDTIQTIVMGVNDHEIDPSNKIFSN